MTSIKFVKLSRPPPHCPSTSKHFPPPWPWTSNFKQTHLTLALPNKLWNNSRIVHVEKRNQNKNKTKSHHIQILPRVLLFDLAHKQLNGIIKEWLHSLTPESIGTFLFNKIIMFDSAWSLVMAQIEFFLIKEINIGSPEHSLPPTPLRPITSHFCLTPLLIPPPPPPNPPKVDVICVSPFKSCSHLLKLGLRISSFYLIIIFWYIWFQFKVVSSECMTLKLVEWKRW